MSVSFAAAILPLFRQIDIAHMKPLGVLLDSYAYMSDASGNSDYPDHANARSVFCYLRGDCSPRMPIHGPYWSPTDLDTFQQWMTDGFLP
jgi:hypothetical protein